MTAIASGVSSLFGSGKLKELEQTNEKLQSEIVKRDKQIHLLHDRMKQIQEHNDGQIHCIKEVHRKELEAKNKKISKLSDVIVQLIFDNQRNAAENFCSKLGFTQELTDWLLAKKKAVQRSGKLYSTQHRKTFDIKNDILKIEKDQNDDTKLALTINRQQLGEWFNG